MFRKFQKEKIPLTGFNNLKKQLSFSFYDFVIAPSEEEKRAYEAYINDRYSAEKIAALLRKIVHIIEANILDESIQDYEPYGASAMLLLSDVKAGASCAKAVDMHLDKSHITAHTYPDFEEPNGLVSFRVDIDISTCGEITPLKCLNQIFDFFDTDVVVIDYIVRGYTRRCDGTKVYIDHKINSIRDYIDPEIMAHFEYKDLILQNDNTWQLKLMRTDYPEDEFFYPEMTMPEVERKAYLGLLYKEIREIFDN
ncbi:S-adenosylmethionine decarboxylase [Hydrogenimonas sp.]